MKFSRRRETEDGPVAAFAGILDGRFLWVAVDAAPGSLALRDSSRDLLPLPSHVPDDQPAYLSARIDLAGLPGTGGATYDVVLVPAGGASATPLWTAPLGPGKPQPAADGHTQHALQRDDDGTLHVRRTSLAEAATLQSVTAEPDGVRLTVRGPGATVALLGDGDAVVATYVTERDGELRTALITTDAVDTAAPQMTRVMLGETGAWLPVRRHANDLADPNAGAPLPQLYAEAGDEPRLRLRWSGRALLQVRILASEETSP